jgi:hypothetical protein
VDSPEELLDLYKEESAATWDRFAALFAFAFPDEWEILLAARQLADEELRALRLRCTPMDAADVAETFARWLLQAKAAMGHDDDRECARRRFNQLVKEVHRRSEGTKRTRQQALSSMLPRRAKQPARTEGTA